MGKDYYKILGLSRSASDEDIKKTIYAADKSFSELT